MQDINLKSKNSLVISSVLLALLPLREQPSFDKNSQGESIYQTYFNKRNSIQTESFTKEK